MKEFFRPALVLLVICVISSSVLAVVYQKTKPIIEENQRKEEQAARQEVVPNAHQFVRLTAGDDEFYAAYDTDDSLVGYAYKCHEKGYSSDVQIMVGLDKELSIIRVKVISQQETPGLGANCVKPEFAGKFVQKNPENLYVDKDGGKISSMSGATITTRAVTNAIRQQFLLIKEHMAQKE